MYAIFIILLLLFKCYVYSIKQCTLPAVKREMNVTEEVKIAFSAGRKSLYISPTQLSVVPMDTVYYNKGNGWNNNINAFVAPVKGVYVLSFGAASGTMTPIYIYLTAGMTPFLELRESAFHKVCSASFPVLLNQGEQVTFRAAEHISLTPCGYPCINFSGFLLFPFE